MLSLHKGAAIFIHVHIDLMGWQLLGSLTFKRTLSVCLQRFNRPLLLLGKDCRFRSDLDRCNILVDLI